MKRDKDKVTEILSQPNILDEICCHIASGGTLVGLAELWDVVFGDLSNWIHSEPEREKRYIKALNDRSEWGTEKVLHELRRIGFSDIREIFRDDGSLKSPKDWPKDVALAVSSVEVDELFDGVGRERRQVGETKKLKLWDKMRALELLGKNLKLFTERHEHQVSETLADLVVGSVKGPETTEGD
jgi:hypothetical protein